jgi:hypothetical protein
VILLLAEPVTNWIVVKNKGYALILACDWPEAKKLRSRVNRGRDYYWFLLSKACDHIE